MEVREPAVRFIRENPYRPYHIQKRWTLAGEMLWYELGDKPISLNDLMTEKGHYFWFYKDAERTRVIITNTQQPLYLYDQQEGQLKRLDAQGAVTPITLCFGTTWFHDFFSQVEAERFISVFQRGDGYGISFGRYGLTLLADKVENKWVFVQQDNPAMKLIENTPGLPVGVAQWCLKTALPNKKCVMCQCSGF